MKTIVVLCVLLISLPALAGTFRDDFEDGDLNGWEKFINNGKIEEKDGNLIITDVDFNIVSLAFFNNGQALKDFTLIFDAKIAKDNEWNVYLWVLFRCNDEGHVSNFLKIS